MPCDRSRLPLKKLHLKGHLLLVEDARDVRQVITRLIEHAGVTVTACGTGEEGLSASETTAIDRDVDVDSTRTE